MNIYKVNKSEFKSKEKEFRKTYIGKKSFGASICMIICVLAISFCLGFSMGYAQSLRQFIYLDGLYLLIFQASGLICSWIGYIYCIYRYDNLLMEYIENK